MRTVRMRMPGSMAFPRNSSYMILYPNMFQKRKLNRLIAAGRCNLRHNEMKPSQYILTPRKSVRRLYEVLLECDLPGYGEPKLEMENSNV